MEPRPPDSDATNAATAGTGGRNALRALVAAGPTHEPIDDVRFIGNRSSGAMGAAIAAALGQAGCEVTFLRGPGVPEVPGCSGGRFTTAAQLLESLRAAWPGHDLLVMAAAVADYRPAQRLQGKLRREDGPMTLALAPTEDILQGLASTRRPGQYVVGFALERPAELMASASAKLARKGADAIVANPLETMEAPDVEATVLFADGSAATPGRRLPKTEFARWLAALVLPRAAARAAGRG